MALDLQSKKLLGKYTPKDRQFPFYSSAAIADGKVVAVCLDCGFRKGALESARGTKVRCSRALMWTFPRISSGE